LAQLIDKIGKGITETNSKGTNRLFSAVKKYENGLI